MARIRVISAADGPSSGPSNDAFDEHNKPRLRRSLICRALKERYPQISSFAESPSFASCDPLDLVGLYSPVHDGAMVGFHVEAWEKWKAMKPWDGDNCHPEWRARDVIDRSNDDGDENDAPPLVPCHSAFRRDGIERPSANVMGAMGYYCTDLVTPVVGTLVKELQEDALTICTAVDFAFNEENSAVYALTTHPGHHASRDCFGGYCYLNNAALCAKLLQRRLETGTSITDYGIISDYWRESYQRNFVAIIDVDYHCGNGTASIFYRDPDIFFASIHCDPEVEYPWNAGYADQTGAGEGKGTTLHIPLKPGTDWEGYRLALEKAMKAVMEFDPEALVVSLGLDTHEGDSVAVNRGGFKLKGSDYYEMGLCVGRHVAGKDVPCVFVQEGGYKMDVVGQAAADVVAGFAIGASEGNCDEK